MEKSFGFLKVIRFPVHEIAMIMSLALRFIPTLMEETEKITKAQKARGVCFDTANILQKAKSLIPITTINLFISSNKEPLTWQQQMKPDVITVAIEQKMKTTAVR